MTLKEEDYYLNLSTPFIPPLKQGAFWRHFCKPSDSGSALKVIEETGKSTENSVESTVKLPKSAPSIPSVYVFGLAIVVVLVLIIVAFRRRKASQ
ncbi:MAG: hypothetical protein DRJ51_04435 [Thermoprotei archaeon]|nr:MAG: hypothetical protein DRJ51_04435 [Thermoprotei archaeon]